MSASSKKKIRKEQNAALLAEKQRKEQKERRKNKITSTLFVIFISVILLGAIALLAVSAIRSSGIRQKNTDTLTVGDITLNSVEFNYYYMDTVNDEATNNSMMLQFQGIDLSKPLNEQYFDEESQTTWADYFIEEAAVSARNDYALCKAAKEANFVVPEEVEDELTEYMASMEFTATLQYGYPTLEEFIVANYGPGASVESYKEYVRNKLIAQAYYNHYSESHEGYSDEARREHEKDNKSNYNSYSYTTYYISYTTYLDVSSEDATEAQKEAARAAAKADADALLTATNPDELNAAIKALPINKDKDVNASSINRALATSISADQLKWLAEDGRKTGDIAALPNEANLTDDNGNEVTVINGYTIVLFEEAFDNNEPLDNVRHLLVSFTGGTQDENGKTVYSDAEKATAKSEAEDLLAQWKSGDATEDSFVALVKEKTDDTASAEVGGLYENVSPDSQYVTNFLAWTVDPDRKAGDTGIVETEYGYHIMYYVGESDITYRDSLIDAELLSAELEEWYNGIISAVTYTVGDTKFLKKDFILQSAG